jgi:hypothetical protein
MKTDDCNCKNGTMQKYSIYMSNSALSNKDDVANVLVEVFDFTPEQADTALSFVSSRGRCLVYSDLSDITIDRFHQIPISLKQHFQVVADGILK